MRHPLDFVMPGLVPGIHVFFSWQPKTWMAGTSPAMTECGGLPRRHRCCISRVPNAADRMRLNVREVALPWRATLRRYPAAYPFTKPCLVSARMGNYMWFRAIGRRCERL
jgi:hypothetical protein